MSASALALIVSSKLLGDAADRLVDLGGAEEVVLHPRHAVRLFHVAADVVHRAVAVDEVELGLGRVGELGHRRVAGPLRDDAQPHLLEDPPRSPGVSADVVVADDRDVVGRRLDLGRLLVEDVVADRVVGDVVAQRLRHAAEALAAHRDDRLADVGGLDLGDRLDVVADKPDRALGLHRDALGEREEAVELVDDDGELLVAAVDDVALLEVGGDVHRAEGVDAGLTVVVVAARPVGVRAAAHRAVADVDDVLDRAPHDALGAGVGAAADRHDARTRLDVGLDRAARAVGRRVVGLEVLRPVRSGLLGIDRRGSRR